MPASAGREDLYAIFTGGDGAVEERIEEAIGFGADHLGLGLGFLTQIADETQEVLVVSGDHELIRRGETCPLDRAYCRRTIELDSSLSVTDAAASSAVARTPTVLFR
jgi:hypothetical protein